MYGGDDIGAVCLDLGSLYTKAGYCGDDTPNAVFNTAVGVTHGTTEINDTDMTNNNRSSISRLNDPVNNANTNNCPLHNMQSIDDETKLQECTCDHDYNNKQSIYNDKQCYTINNRTYYVGRSQHYIHDNMTIQYPIQYGIINNYDAIEANIQYAFNNHMSVNLSEHPLLLCEQVYTPHQQRENMLDLLMNKFDLPAVFFAKSPVLSSFANGRSTSCVVSIGHDIMSIVPVNDGYVLHKAIRRTKLAGNMLDQLVEKCIPIFNTQNNNNILIPQYILQNSSNIDKTILEFHKYNTLRDIKESVCKLTDHVYDYTNTQHSIQLPSQPYTLPDGQNINIENQRFIIAEQLLRPNSLYVNTHDIMLDNNQYEYTGLHKLISHVIDNCDADLRRQLYENIVLSGGSTLIPGLNERLTNDISNNIGPLYKVKILTGNSINNKRYSDWLGGSILGSLGSFHQMWISKKEYLEYGNSIIHRKCP